MRTFAFRLSPGQDLRKELERFTKEKRLKAGVVLAGVGSLGSARIRFAGAEKEKNFEGKYEIVSVTGTLSQDGLHVHLSIADEEGNVFGGHLKEGCVARTTIEVVIGELEELEFSRKRDPQTGFDELVIKG